MKNLFGSHFLSIDGVRRSYRDRREIAVETAGRLMADPVRAL